MEGISETQDALGRELTIGDEVAYIRRQSSSLSVELRKISDIKEQDGYNGKRVLIQFEGSFAWAAPYNVVRL